MKTSLPAPCVEWEEMLAVVSPADLAPSDQAALQAHLATCAACAAAKAAYQWMDAQIRALPAARPLDGLPPRLLRRWGEEDRRASARRDGACFRVQEQATQTIEHPDTQIPAAPLTLRPPRRRVPRLVSTLSAAAALALVVVVIAALFISRASMPFAGSGQWVEVPTLSNTPALPIFAPGNPRVVYEALPSGLRRSDDQGATWQKLPMQADARITSQGHPILFASPLDAHMVFLTLPGAAALAPEQCPASVAAIYPCAIQFYSQDGGAHWKPLHLPLPGVLGSPIFYDNPSLIIGFPNIGALRAQGDHLYSAVGEPPSIGVDNQGGAELVGNGARLVTSTDGGVTWQVADTALAERGQLVCDYASVPTGSTVFALTESTVCGGPTDLWRSDDAGKHWTHVGALPNLAVRGLTVVDRGAAAQPLLYLSTQDLGQQLHTQGILQASTDGGKTWQAAPNPDPIAGREFLGPLGVLSDGSVIVASLPTLGKAIPTFLAWEAGARAWRQLAPPLDYMAYLLVTPDAAGGNGTLWLVTSSQQGSYSVYRY